MSGINRLCLTRHYMVQKNMTDKVWSASGTTTAYIAATALSCPNELANAKPHPGGGKPLNEWPSRDDGIFEFDLPAPCWLPAWIPV